MSARHAYMVMAHTQFDLLATLLRLLDDTRNDIYLHVDVKARDFDAESLGEVVTRAGLVFVERRDVRWGGFSEIECELALLEAATERPHRYYHLLSGMDLPLKTQDEIHDFFAARDGDEFVHLSPIDEWASTHYRVQTWHPLQERLMSGGRAVNAAAKLLTRAQLALHVQRTNGVEFGFGSQWFSITHDLALHTLAQTDAINRTFRSSQCASEMFMQTVAQASPQARHVTGDALRKVDWTRGDGKHPHVWRIEDLPDLENAEETFARKFDGTVDADIIALLAHRLAPCRQPEDQR